MQPAAQHTAVLPVRGQVQLHVLPEPAALAAATAQRFSQWLSPVEHKRWQRLRLEADRQRFLLARALVRSVLGTCVQQAPESLQFVCNHYGKPELLQPAATPEQTLRFNLSHTRGLLVLAVTAADEIGVDVESITREAEMLALAERYFAASEVAMLRAADPLQLHELFFRLWTLKEAYVKARGLGLQLGLDSFAIGLGRNSTPALLHAEDDDIARWSCFSIAHADVFRIAVAVSAPTASLQLNEVHLF
jgi:4'-phosphopantetheinyl transferase